MNKPILQPLQNCISSALGWGGVRFHFEGDGKQTEGGKVEGQQQQVVEFVDPLKDLDQDLLDDQSRALINKARESFKTTHASLQSLQTRATEADRLKEELAVAKSQLEQKPADRQQQQQQQAKEPTLEEMIAQELRDNGVDPKLIPGQVKILAGIQNKVMGPVKKYIDDGQQALAGGLAMQEAKADFVAMSYHEDERVSALFENDEIKQKVWERVEANVKEGRPASSEFMIGLAKIFSFDMDPTQQQQQTNVPVARITQPSNTRSQVTRHTFPHSGQHIRATSARTIASPEMNADTQAAVDVAVGIMKNGNSNNGDLKITRTGRNG